MVLLFNRVLLINTLVLLNLLFFLLFLSWLLLSSFLSQFPLHYLSPISAHILMNPVLHLKSWYSLHAENLQSDVVFAWVRIWYSFYTYVVTSTCMLSHWINRCEFFRAFRTMKMFGFLVMMQNNLIFKGFLTIKTEWFQTWHISSFPSHYIDKQSLNLL